MMNIQRFSTGMVPFYPASFGDLNDSDAAIIAWSRILIYGGISLAAWNKARRLSYVALAATGISLAVSLATPHQIPPPAKKVAPLEDQNKMAQTGGLINGD